VFAVESVGGLTLHFEGLSFSIGTQRPPRSRGASHEAGDGEQFTDGVWTLPSPLTGAVVEIRVRTGEDVDAGQVLILVEAMKMQNELRSRVAGRVEAVLVETGQRVELGSPLVRVRQAEGEPQQ
jgi:biotin carboxyl carrier protein